ncbi:MAG: tRNA uridine-5-carboxymethylaminomethyl(34) synthesis GTPase MnmE [Sphingomonadales bacterium]|nr:tRNA uridine-5-carboxymethylaminomethyl(34) synthesis GTPase MnmE [Sphingomonadales bacterium]
MSAADTIFALASGRGRAGVAVIRVSGPAAVSVAEALAGSCPPPRRAALRQLRQGPDNGLLDEGIVIYFQSPRSFTGEDVVEFHVHGGPAVVAAVLAAIAQVPGARLAEAGEFTRRAFDNGRLDLTAVEGLADLIAAETEAQRRQALRQARGELAAVYDGWRQWLLSALAYVEAAIDFADEEVPEEVAARARPEVDALRLEIMQALTDERRGERLRDGFEIAILGEPNSGKSSLLNALAKRDVAIVSARAGTTRDALEVHLDLEGLPVTLVDTAGLREGGDEVESEGIRRAHVRAEEADLRLVLIPADVWPAIPAAVQGYAEGPGALLVVSKSDLLANQPPGDVIAVSVRTGVGIDALMAALCRRAETSLGGGETAVITRQRHRQALTEAVAYLAAFLAAPKELELQAEDLRLAARALGRVTGRVEVEDVLGTIFAEFCIGK